MSEPAARAGDGPAGVPNRPASSPTVKGALGDLLRTRNSASTISLCGDLDRSGLSSSSINTATATGGGTLTKLRNLSQIRLFKQDPAPALCSPSSGQPTSSMHVTGNRASTLPDVQEPRSNAESNGSSSKLIKRRSRLLDAFRSKRPQSSFEVVRKPLGQRSNSSQTQLHQSSPQREGLEQVKPAADVPASGPVLAASTTHAAERPPRQRTFSDGTLDPRQSGSASITSDTEREPANRYSDTMQIRAAHPPSTTRTRRPAPGLGLPFGRRHSGLAVDSAASNSSRGVSPLPSPGVDTGAGTFSLHSFRNVRSASDASKAEAAGNVQSRRQGVFAGEEFVTPTEELLLPSLFGGGDDVRSRESNRSSVVLSPPQVKAASPGKAAAATTPFVGQPNASSISVAKFRQAARSRSELGGTGTADDSGAAGTPRLYLGDLQDYNEKLQSPSLAFMGSPGAMSPSQELAALEAELSQGGRSTPLLKLLKERERSVSPAAAPGGPATDETANGARTNEASAAGKLAPAAEVSGEAQDPSSLSRQACARPRERGLFLVVEGLDRAGKSTQVARLANKLDAKEIKFPDRTTAIGQMINSYLSQTSNLDDKAIHLLFSANRWECVQSILGTLAGGQTIVCDRYAFSGIAYSCAKGLRFDWCKAPDIGLPLPDLTLFLDLDAETAAARGGYGEERYEKREFQAKVREAFKLVSSEVQSHGGRWATVNAAGSLDEVTREIQRAVLESTATIDRRIGELGRLFTDSRPPAAGHLSDEMIDQRKRQSIDGLGSLANGSMLLHFRSGSPGAQGPVAPPSTEPTKVAISSYAEQLAAMRAAAAGTLTGLFGLQQAEADKPSALGLVPNPSTTAAKGQGVDSERALASYNAARPGRRMTLVDMIDQIEAGRSPDSASVGLPPPTLPWIAAERPARSRVNSQGSTVAAEPVVAVATDNATGPATTTTATAGERYPSTFALGNRSRRSLNVSDLVRGQTVPSTRAAISDSFEDNDNDDDDPEYARAAKRAAPVPAAAQTGSTPRPAVSDAAARPVPLITPSPLRAASISQRTTTTTLESAISTPATEDGESPTVDMGKQTVVSSPAASPAESQKLTKSPLQGSGSRQATPQVRPQLDSKKGFSVSPGPPGASSSRPRSTSPAPPPSRSPGLPHLYRSMMAGVGGIGGQQLNPQQLAMLAAQQQQMQQMEMQQQYIQQYMAATSMMQDPVMAKRAYAQAQAQYQYQYQMTLMQQQQKHFFAHGGSEVGAGMRQQQPSAAFMQPGVSGLPYHSSSMSDFGAPTGAGGGGASERRNGQAHTRMRSSSSGLDAFANEATATQSTRNRGASPPSSPQQPMLSMMMVAPPTSVSPAPPASPHGQPAQYMMPTQPFFPYAYARPGSMAQSEIGTSTAPRAHRASRASAVVAAGAMGPPSLPTNTASKVANGRLHH